MTPSHRLRSLLLPALAALRRAGAAARRRRAGATLRARRGRRALRALGGPPGRAAVQRATGVGEPQAFAPRTRVMKIRDGQTVVGDGARAARPARGRHRGAQPDRPRERVHPAPTRACAGVPGGWQQIQWNFLAETGVNAPDAWQRLIDVGRPGGTGVTVAVLDTGVAYSDRGRCPRSADSRRTSCRRSPDFGDFVAATTSSTTTRGPTTRTATGRTSRARSARAPDDDVGVTGLAYGARIMPVRVLDRLGEGDSVAISRGHPLRRRNGANVINLSFEFGTQVTRAEIPDILAALRYARRKGALVVGASGNAAARSVAYPARASQVLSVGATTQHGCVAEYSNNGANLDIVAPGGGEDAAHPRRSELPARRAAGRQHLPDDLRRLAAPLRAARRLHGHLDGRAARDAPRPRS